jgi:hypothetical protein
VDGVVVLGGAVSTSISTDWERPKRKASRSLGRIGAEPSHPPNPTAKFIHWKAMTMPLNKKYISIAGLIIPTYADLRQIGDI